MCMVHQYTPSIQTPIKYSLCRRCERTVSSDRVLCAVLGWVYGVVVTRGRFSQRSASHATESHTYTDTNTHFPPACRHRAASAVVAVVGPQYPSGRSVTRSLALQSPSVSQSVNHLLVFSSHFVRRSHTRVLTPINMIIA